MVDEVTEGTPPTSLFNMAIATLQRIHNLLVESHQCSLGVGATADHHTLQQQTQQLKALDRVYLEIRPYIDDTEVTKILESRAALSKMFKKQLGTFDPYEELMTYEAYMRETKWCRNMLMPKADDATLAFRG